MDRIPRDNHIRQMPDGIPPEHFECRLAPDAEVVTDALGCRIALGHAGCNHWAIRTGSGRGAAQMAPFKWVNTTFENIRSAITGTYRKPGPDHAERYLASFA